MQYCTFCGAVLPSHAQFCGACGHIFSATAERATAIGSDPGLLSTLALMSDPSHPVVGGGQEEELDATIRIRRSDEGKNEHSQPFRERHTEESQAIMLEDVENQPTRPLGEEESEEDEEERRRRMLLGLPLLGALLADGGPAAGGVPMVSGTPQIGGVPMVSGTPTIAGVSPAGQVLSQATAPSVSSPFAPPSPHPGPWTPPHFTPPESPLMPGSSPSVPRSPGPGAPPSPGPGSPPSAGPSAPPAPGPLAPPSLGPSPRPGSPGCLPVWLMILIAIIVIISSLFGGFFFFLPTPSLSGSADIASGGMEHLHGSGFISSAVVTLWLDGHVQLFPAGHSLTKTRYADGGVGVLASQMMIAGQLQQAVAADSTIPVSRAGTFDVTIAVSQRWSVGSHTIEAREEVIGIGVRTAVLKFRIDATAAKLAVSPSTLDYGKLAKGVKPMLAVEIRNIGGQRLTWTADTEGTKWLKVQENADGAIEPDGPEQILYVTVDTSSLAPGSYSGNLHIDSNGGDAQVGVKLQVVPSRGNQAVLDVTPTSIAFNEQAGGVGQQTPMVVAVGNVGTKALNWKADTGNTSWLTLDTTSGTVQPGSRPQTINVTANTKSLTVGNYSATIQINSNGGNAQVAVMLTVTPGSSNTPPPAAILTASPTSLNANADCSYTVGQGWACAATLSSSRTAQGNLNWTASSSGVSGVTFSPASGVLSPGQTARVNIFIPNTVCPANADFTFRGPGNAVDVLWNCAAPSLTASPAKLSTGCLSCTVTLTLAQGSQGGLNWSASSSGISGVTFAPRNGSLFAGQSASVVVSVPNTTCPPSASFLFKGPANTAQVTWNCVPPKLAVSPSQFARTDCSYNQGWTCVASLMNLDTVRTLNWSTSSSGISGITFSPPGGTLQPSGKASVSIFVPNTTCPASATLVFTGPLNTVDVPWTCAPPQIGVSPTSFNNPGDANCSYSADQGWTCQALVSDQDTQLSVSWSVSGSGATFTPSSGTLAPGQTAKVSIFVPDQTCPTSATFSFAGPANTVNVKWSCAAPTLAADLGSCSYNGGWTCIAEVSSSSNNQGKLKWSTSSSGISGIAFSPANGTLIAGQAENVAVGVPDTICPNSATFNFIGPGNTVSLSWSCPTATLTVSPTSFYVYDDCTPNSDATVYTCTDTLSSGTGNQGGLNWSVSNGGNGGITFSQPDGSLYPGNQVQVTITVVVADCSNSAPTVSSSVSGSNPINVAWSC